MPPKPKATKSTKKRSSTSTTTKRLSRPLLLRDESQPDELDIQQKSPAEFFAEHQAIAGFDNAGRSLYTSLRELVENGLDAAESIGELPQVTITLREWTQAEFNVWRDQQERRDEKDDDEEETTDGSENGKTKSTGDKKDDDKDTEDTAKKPLETTTADPSKPSASSKPPRKKAPQEAYFLLSVQDNGCGMSHASVPNLLGRVLSGSKHGVCQTRGKFGLGSKMALIWSKKSTGMPITIQTAHRKRRKVSKTNKHHPTTTATSLPIPKHYTVCRLDMNIAENEPKVLQHDELDNSKEQWIGTKVELAIAGNWTTYRSRVLQYLQQLAIITPYATFEFRYTSQSDPKRNLEVTYRRRSEQVPPLARPVKHHPSSINHWILQQLLRDTRTTTLAQFLRTELSSVSAPAAQSLIHALQTSCSQTVTPQTPPKDLTDQTVTRLVQILRATQSTGKKRLIAPPSGACLSPLGEYNLQLGIQQVLQPDYVATARDKPGAYEGHPFVVEAAVSLGGRGRGKPQQQGGGDMTIVRFANRIPLLFEAGADVVTRVAQHKIKWLSSYKINPKVDRVGVFVSLVSTKIPFKGTSKEYIGDEATDIAASVKRALQLCGQQLRVQLTKRHALKEAKERKSKLAKYVPDVSRSIMGLLEGMRKRRREEEEDEDDHMDDREEDKDAGNKSKRRRLLDSAAADQMMQQLDRGTITQDRIVKALKDSIEAQHQDGGEGHSTAASSTRPRKPLYLVPLYNTKSHHDVVHPLFTFRPILPVRDLTTRRTKHKASATTSLAS